MAHKDTGWQFSTQLTPEAMEMGDYGIQKKSQGEPQWIKENPRLASENFETRRQSVLSVGSASSSNILSELPSHQIDNAFEAARTNGVVGNTRKNKFATLRIRKAAMSQGRDNIDQMDVIDAFARDPELNQSTPESEQLRMEAIRDLHYSLSMKRTLKRQLSQTPARKSFQRPDCSSRMRFALKRGFQRFRIKFREGVRRIDLWRPHIREIEGRFGSSTAYYFRFLQQLVLLNILIFIISCSFILVPQLLWRFLSDSDFNRTTTDGNDNIGIKAYLVNASQANPWVQEKKADVRNSYSLMKEAYVAKNSSSEERFSWKDILTGSGYLAHTELYYGAYVNYTVDIIGDSDYNLPLAYLLATVSHLLLCLVLLARWVASAYKKYLAVNSSYGAHTLCNLIFCSWDFKIVSHETSILKHMGILHDLQDKVEKLKSEMQTMNFCAKCDKYTKHVVNHVVAFATMAMCGYLTWFLLERNTLQTDLPVLTEMTLPLVITGIFIVLPTIFTVMVGWEGYRANSTEVYVTLLRMMLLLMTVLGVLCYFWFGTRYDNSHYDHNICWETRLGEEIYRLLLVDFIVSTVLYFLVSFLRKFVIFSKLLGNPEFSLAWNTWNLIYNQILCWLSSLYSPLVSGLVILKLILTFYIKQLHLRINCTPPAKPWGASQAKTVFLLTAFLGLIATLVPVGYSIISMTPSYECGPFRGKLSVYHVVFDLLEYFHIKKEWLGMIVYFVTRPGCVAGIIVILCAIAFQAKAHAKTNKDMVKRLQQQLILEGTDKNFLLQMVDKATQLQMKPLVNEDSSFQLPSNRRPLRQGQRHQQPTTNGQPHTVRVETGSRPNLINVNDRGERPNVCNYDFNQTGEATAQNRPSQGQLPPVSTDSIRN